MVAFSIKTMVADSKKGLVVYNLPMFFPPKVYRLYDTTYRDRRRAFDIPDATGLETSDAQITKGHVGRGICSGCWVSPLL